MGQLGWQALQVFRATAGRGAADAGDGARPIAFLSIAAVGGWAALVVAGMFEYNFGDSEVLILFLFMMSAPFSGEC
jgi:hypothetical protein